MRRAACSAQHAVCSMRWAACDVRHAALDVLLVLLHAVLLNFGPGTSFTLDAFESAGAFVAKSGNAAFIDRSYHFPGAIIGRVAPELEGKKVLSEVPP